MLSTTSASNCRSASASATRCSRVAFSSCKRASFSRKRGLRRMVFGDVVAFAENARDLAGVVDDRLVDEVEDALDRRPVGREP